MPLYIFKHPEKPIYKEIVQKMNDEHTYSEDGVLWERKFTVPNAIVKSLSDINPFNIAEQVEKTGNMKGSIGDLQDLSAEMSERREDMTGAPDPIKQKYFKDWEKAKGKKHFKDRPDKIETEHAVIDFTKGSLLPDN